MDKKNDNDMAHANEVLHCYSLLAEHSSRMAQLAAAREWAQLPALETQCAAIIERLKDLPSAESLETSLRDQACQLIARIRADQETVARLVQPQLDDLLSRMGSLNAQRSLDKAYGSRH